MTRKPLTPEQREHLRTIARKGGVARAAKQAAAKAPLGPYTGTFLDFLDAIGRGGESRAVWRVFWKAADGLPMTDEELEVFRLHTHRTHAPTTPASECWIVAGRRAGKSENTTARATWRAISFDRSRLQPGEMATIPLVAADRAQARNSLRYLQGLARTPVVAPYVSRILKESVEFRTGVVVQVMTSSYRAVRGFTMADAILEEVAFFPADDSANPDEEVLAAIRPAMLTVPGARIYGISSPHARRGVLWTAYEQHFGRDDSDVLVFVSDTASLNPTVDRRKIAREFENDPSRAAAEYGSEGLVAFRSDVESFLSPEAIAAVTATGRRELPPRSDVSYVGFTDPSGGSQDSFTLAISHSEGDRAVLDVVREVRPPFSPDAIVQEFAALLQTYRISTVHGDHYAGEWPRERFAAHGVQYQPEERSKSELYGLLLPVVNAGRVELLDLPRVRAQLLGLERRVARGGRDSIDHAPGGHDDLANAVAGALVRASKALPEFARWAKKEAERAVSPVPEEARPHTGVVSVESRRLGPTPDDLRAAVPTTCPSCGSRLVVVDGRDSYGRASWRCGACNANGQTGAVAQDRKAFAIAGLTRDGGGTTIPLAGLIAATKRVG